MTTLMRGRSVRETTHVNVLHTRPEIGQEIEHDRKRGRVCGFFENGDIQVEVNGNFHRFPKSSFKGEYR